MPDLIGFRQTEIHIAAQHVVQSQKFCRDLVRYLDQILRPFPQQNALLRQLDAEAVACKQLFPQLVLQGF